MIPMRWIILPGLLFPGLFGGVRAAEPASKTEPLSFYRPKATWWETMIASREALIEQEEAAARWAEVEQRQADPEAKTFTPLRMSLSSLDGPRRIRLRLGDATRLYIGDFGVDAVLANPRVIGADGNTRPLLITDAHVHGHPSHYQGKLPEWWEESRQYGMGAFFRGGEGVEASSDLPPGSEWLGGWVFVQRQKEFRTSDFWIDWRPVKSVVISGRAALRALVDAVAAAFPSGIDMRQQAHEVALDIWRVDWKPGDLADLAGLAGRFAAACDETRRPVAQELAKSCRSIADLRRVRGLFYAQYVEPRLALAHKTLELVERAARRSEPAAELKAPEKRVAEPKDDRASPGPEPWARCWPGMRTRTERSGSN